VYGLVPIARHKALVAADLLMPIKGRNVSTTAVVEDQPAGGDQGLTSTVNPAFPDMYGLVWIEHGGDVGGVPSEPSGIVRDAPQTDVGQADIDRKLRRERIGEELGAHLPDPHPHSR
jgi:hypothetical protein